MNDSFTLIRLTIILYDIFFVRVTPVSPSAVAVTRRTTIDTRHFPVPAFPNNLFLEIEIYFSLNILD